MYVQKLRVVVELLETTGDLDSAPHIDNMMIVLSFEIHVSSIHFAPFHTKQRTHTHNLVNYEAVSPAETQLGATDTIIHFTIQVQSISPAGPDANGKLAVAFRTPSASGDRLLGIRGGSFIQWETFAYVSYMPNCDCCALTPTVFPIISEEHVHTYKTNIVRVCALY